MNHHDDTAPPMRAIPPAAPAFAYRAGVSCGLAGHARELLEATSERRLDRKIVAWRCPTATCPTATCQRPAYGERIDGAQR